MESKSKRWTAKQMGEIGGLSKSASKLAALAKAREISAKVRAERKRQRLAALASQK